MVLKLSELLWLFLNQSDHGLGDFLIKKESNQDLDLYFWRTEFFFASLVFEFAIPEDIIYSLWGLFSLEKTLL